jgi:hypothetical protein
MLELKLVDVLASLAVVLLAGVARLLFTLRDDVRTLRLILVGEKGDNGIKSQVDQLDECIDELRAGATKLEGRVNRQEDIIQDLRQRHV